MRSWCEGLLQPLRCLNMGRGARAAGWWAPPGSPAAFRAGAGEAEPAQPSAQAPRRWQRGPHQPEARPLGQLSARELVLPELGSSLRASPAGKVRWRFPLGRCGAEGRGSGGHYAHGSVGGQKPLNGNEKNF